MKMMRKEALSSWIVAILLGLSFYFCGLSFSNSTSDVFKLIAMTTVVIYTYRGFYYWNKPRTRPPESRPRENFIKGFLSHFLWSSAILLLFYQFFGVLSIVTKEVSLSRLIIMNAPREYAEGWIILCGPYLFLQLICYMIYRRFYYLAFLATYSWVPRGYEHEPKDGVFSGLWMLLVIAVVVLFPSLWQT